MSTTMSRRMGFDFLAKAACVLLTFQLAAFASVALVQGVDDTPNGYLFIVMCTALFVAAHRKLAAKGVNGGASWLLAARATALALLAIASLLIVFRGYLHPPAPELAAHVVTVAMWAVIALKGAAVGKFKPGGPLGLRIRWTLTSRLAWDKAHRMLGRVLFWGGLFGLAASFFVPPPVSMLQWFAVVALGVTLAVLESWRTWRSDPERSSGRVA